MLDLALLSDENSIYRLNLVRQCVFKQDLLTSELSDPRHEFESNSVSYNQNFRHSQTKVKSY